jgi:hypothetical protein
VFLTEGAISRDCVTVQLSFVVLVLHQALEENEPESDPNGVGTATKAKSIDAITWLVAAAYKLVALDDVSLEAPAKHATEQSQWLER